MPILEDAPAPPETTTGRGGSARTRNGIMVKPLERTPRAHPDALALGGRYAAARTSPICIASASATRMPSIPAVMMPPA